MMASRPCLLALCLLAAPLASPAPAAPLAPADRAELKRALAMVGPATSEEPAVRQERRARDPSAAFMLGAALGAWQSAAATLRYDLATPSGDGDDSEAIAIDCYDERIAFDHLQTRTSALGLTPPQVVEDAGLAPGEVLTAWRARQAGASPRCR
jgi:hypothetical protein